MWLTEIQTPSYILPQQKLRKQAWGVTVSERPETIKIKIFQFFAALIVKKFFEVLWDKVNENAQNV